MKAVKKQLPLVVRSIKTVNAMNSMVTTVDTAIWPTGKMLRQRQRPHHQMQCFRAVLLFCFVLFFFWRGEGNSSYPGNSIVFLSPIPGSLQCYHFTPETVVNSEAECHDQRQHGPSRRQLSTTM